MGQRGQEITKDSAGQERTHLTQSCLSRGLRLASYMKALVALAHWPAGLTLRENVLNLRFTTREIAIGWFPRRSAGRLGFSMNLLTFYIVRHDGSYSILVKVFHSYGTCSCGTLSRAIDGIRSARRQHADGALQMIHMLLHLRQRTINLFAGAVPQRMDARTGPESNRFS